MSAKWERLDGHPGVYVDGDGRLHFVLGEMLIAEGFSPTLENMLTLEKAARELALKVNIPAITIESADDPTK